MAFKPQADSASGLIASTQPAVRLAQKHHLLVRVSHWLNVLLLAGLIVSGISIYWASPIYQHSRDAQTGNSDYFADAGVWFCAHVPGMHSYVSPPDWLYNHFSLGPYMLAPAMRLHWCCAYLFMVNALVYLAGLCFGGEWRSLLPRASDGRGALFMAKYYLSVPFALLRRCRRVPPRFNSQYNPLQRLAYFSIPIAGFLSVVSGWEIHKPMQLSWVAALFGGFDRARVWHFWLMFFFITFVVPHVILVFADGWDTVRSMITGWSKRWEMGGESH